MTRPPGVALRRATAADLASVAAIEQASFGDPWSAGSFRSLVANPTVAFVVAATGATGATVVGYAVAWFAADEAELANLAVAASARGRGVGALLLDAVLAEAAHRGAATVYLEVRESNAAARRLYASRSFAEVGRRRRYYHNPAEDALVLARPIAPGPAAAPPPDPGRSATAHRG